MPVACAPGASADSESLDSCLVGVGDRLLYGGLLGTGGRPYQGDRRGTKGVSPQHPRLHRNGVSGDPSKRSVHAEYGAGGVSRDDCWTCPTPKPGGEPSGKIYDMLEGSDVVSLPNVYTIEGPVIGQADR